MLLPRLRTNSFFVTLSSDTFWHKTVSPAFENLKSMPALMNADVYLMLL